MNKNLYTYILLLSSLIGTSFSIAAGITFGDVFCLLLMLQAVPKLLKKKWRMDFFFKVSFTYVIMMLLSATLNGTLTNTIFINFIRIAFDGCLVYLCLRNTLKTEEDVKLFIKIMLIFPLFFAVKLKQILESTFNPDVLSIHEVEFDNGRNGFGFTALLYLLFVLLAYYKNFLNRLPSLIICTFLLGCIYFSVSRAAILLALITIVMYVITVELKRISTHQVVIYLALLLFIPIILHMLSSYISLGVLESGQELLESKMEDTGSDFIDIRIYFINIIPIKESFRQFSLLQTLFGDGLTVRHSFIAHSLIVTGLIGFIVFCYSILVPMFHYWRKGFLGKSFVYVMALMLYNDFLTNARYIIHENTMLYMIICAIFVSLINISNYEVILFNRVHK